VNPTTRGGSPVVLVTDAVTGAVTEHRTPALPGPDEAFVILEAGAGRTHVFALSKVVPLPGPGRFLVRTRYAWEGGTIESPEVPVEIAPGEPLALCRESLTGGFAGAMLCAWADRETLWLTSIDVGGAPRFESSVDLGPAPGAPFALSVPPHALPVRQHVAWVDGDGLRMRTAWHGVMEPGPRIELGGPGFSIVAPLIEDGVGADMPGAEALLVRDGGGGWECAVVPLAAGHGPIDRRRFEGPAPVWGRTVVRSDGLRCSLFLRDGSAAGEALEGAVAPWAPRRGPERLHEAMRVPGRFLAADLALLGDERVSAAILAGGADGSRVALHRFEIGWDGTTVARGAHEIVLERAPARAVVRIDGTGEPCALLLDRGRGLAFMGPDGHLRMLDAGGLRQDGPLELCFAEERVPVVLFARDGVGLSTLPLGPVTTRRPPPT
jgi:hypothetical protein